MQDDHFLFQEGMWEGTGQVSFSQSPEVLQFTTTWTVSKAKEDGTIQAVQVVKVSDSESMENRFLLTPSRSGEFLVKLDNKTIGSYQGQGVFDEECIGWEFVFPDVFEGLEVYERTLNGYFFHGKYNSQGGFGTQIKGTMKRIRPKKKKNTPVS